MDHKFYLSDLEKLAREYEGRVPPRKIRLILEYVKLEDLTQAREALDLYLSDGEVKKTIDNFIQEHSK